MLSKDSDHFEDPDISDGSRAQIALLHDLSAWREHLARSIARNNHGLQSETIAAAANRITGRFLFLRIAEDRGLINAGTLRQIHDATDPVAAVSALLFTVGDPWAEIPIKGRSDTTIKNPVIIEDRVIQNLLLQLCHPDRQYHFGTISNAMIAEVFDHHFKQAIRRTAANRAVVVETQDMLQSQGTPTPSSEMIEFLVHQSLEGVLANRNLDDMPPIRILDLACGSGRLLISACQHILSRSGKSRHTLPEQREHLYASIHGVDLDPHAVAVAKMLLLFELCEKAGARILPETFLELAGSVFRALENNILCGNSLIDKDIYSEDSIAFFPVRERHRINPLDWENAFPEVLRAGGFDMVLGNLPEGPLSPDEWIQRYFQRHYKVYHLKADRSAYFMERGLSLLCPGGMLACIAGNRWLRSKSAAQLRKHLLSYQIEEIADYGTETKNTSHASLCIIRITRCPASHAFYVTHLDSRSNAPLEIQAHNGRFPIDQTVLGGSGWKFCDTRVQDILEKVRNAGTLLEEVVLGRIHQGIITGYEEAFVIDTLKRKELIEASPNSKSLIRPFIPGEEIVRYGYPPLSRAIIFIPQGWTKAHARDQAGWQWFRKKYPAIARHLKPFADRAKVRKHQGDFWWECPCEPGMFDQHQSRIIFASSGEYPVFMFDSGEAIPDRHSHFISSSNLFLLAVLNSRLSSFIFHVTAQKNTEKKQRQVEEWIAGFPIYTPDLDDPLDVDRHDRMTTLVNGMLDLQKHMSLTRSERVKRLIMQEIESTDRQIDSLVYGLYGLTSDEVALIETPRQIEFPVFQ